MTRVQCLCGADLAISEASSGVVMRVEPHSCAGFSPLNANDARPGDALRDLFREHGFGGSIIERDVLAVVEANPGRDTGSSVCEWCKDWTPTVENPCAYCGRDDYTDRLCAKEADEYARPDHPSHATPDRPANTAPLKLPPANLPNVIRKTSLFGGLRYFLRVPEPDDE